MSRPTLLDLFCGAGGASAGYSRAGFDVTGVDIKPQPRYSHRFIQGDALAYLAEHGREYDAVHASPPCQHYSRATAWRGDRASHPDLIGATQSAIRAVGRPYIIENVQEARHILRSPVMLCGTVLGLQVRRHRYFETSFCMPILPPCRHQPDDYSFDHGGKQTEAVYRDALGCDWMTVHDARQAIPPAYTFWIGTMAMQSILDAEPKPLDYALLRQQYQRDHIPLCKGCGQPMFCIMHRVWRCQGKYKAGRRWATCPAPEQWERPNERARLLILELLDRLDPPAPTPPQRRTIEWRPSPDDPGHVVLERRHLTQAVDLLEDRAR